MVLWLDVGWGFGFVGGNELSQLCHETLDGTLLWDIVF